LIHAPLLLQAALMFTPPAFPFRALSAKHRLPLTPGLLFTTPPVIPLLIGQAGLLAPLPILVLVLSIARAAFLPGVSTLFVALSFPLASLLAKLLFLRSPLFLG
jgi:hypothetical protein